MSDIWASPTGSASGLGTRSMPYDADTAEAAAASGDRVLLRRGIYAQSLTITKAGVTLEGVDGVARFYGGTEITGTWALYSGSVWRVAKASSPRALIIRTRSGLFIKGEKRDSLAEVTDDLYWYWSGGYLYLYSSDGDPSVAYYRVDDTTTQGTNGAYAGGLAYGGIYLGDGFDDVTLRNIGACGFYGNGLLADDVTGLTCDHSEFSFNGEDGNGGFGMVDWTLSECEMSWNGNRRVRVGEVISTDGDGASCHLGAVESTNFSIKDCRFIGNCKDAVQNIQGSTGVVERCYVEDCAGGLIYNATATQTFRNNTVVATARCPGAFIIINVGTANVYNNTFVGADTAFVSAFNFYFGVGTIVARNNIVDNFSIGVANTTGTFTHSYNVWNVTTRGVTLGTGEVDGDPQLYGSRRGIRSDSIAAFTGTDLTAQGYTDDRFRRGRLTGEWSIGAVEVVGITPRSRALEGLATALEAIGDQSDQWQTPQEVNQVVRFGDLKSAPEPPFIAITRADETYGWQAVQSLYDRRLSVEFTFTPPDDWESFDYLGAIAHDVELALGKDRTLGGVVTDTTLKTNTSRIDGQASAMTFTVEIQYRTEAANPLTRT